MGPYRAGLQVLHQAYHIRAARAESFSHRTCRQPVRGATLPEMASHLYPVLEHSLALGAQSFSSSGGLLLGMDYSAWPPDNAFQAELGDLNLLEPPAPQPSAGDALFSLQGELRPSVEEERVAKRSREAIERESLESFLRELAKEPAEPARSEPHQSSSGDEKRAAGRHSTDAAAAARAKAGRERARRERLNGVCHRTLATVCRQCLALVLTRRAVLRMLLYGARRCRGCSQAQFVCHTTCTLSC